VWKIGVDEKFDEIYYVAPSNNEVASFYEKIACRDTILRIKLY